MRFWAGLAVSLLFLWLLSSQLDADVLLQAARGINAGWLLPALLALALDYLLRILRWTLLLRTFNPTLPVSHCAGPFIASFAINNVVPLRAGDITRAFAFGKLLGTAGDKVTATLVIERVLDLGALLALLSISLLLIPATSKLDLLAYAGISALFFGMLALLFAPQFWQQLFRSLPLPEGKIRQFVDQVFTALTAVRGLFKWLALVALSGLVWVLEGVTFLCTALAVTPLETLSAPWLALSLGSLGTLLPSSPGYVGTFDYFAAQGFSLAGVEPALAASIAVLIHLVLWLPVTVIGLSWLARHWGTGALVRLQQLRKEH